MLLFPLGEDGREIHDIGVIGTRLRRRCPDLFAIKGECDGRDVRRLKGERSRHFEILGEGPLSHSSIDRRLVPIHIDLDPGFLAVGNTEGEDGARGCRLNGSRHATVGIRGIRETRDGDIGNIINRLLAPVEEYHRNDDEHHGCHHDTEDDRKIQARQAEGCSPRRMALTTQSRGHVSLDERVAHAGIAMGGVAEGGKAARKRRLRATRAARGIREGLGPLPRKAPRTIEGSGIPAFRPSPTVPTRIIKGNGTAAGRSRTVAATGPTIPLSTPALPMLPLSQVWLLIASSSSPTLRAYALTMFLE